MVDLRTLGDVVARRPNGDGVELAQNLTRHLIYLGDELNLVAKELDAQRMLGIGREHVHALASHAEAAPGQVHVVAVVLNVDEGVDKVVTLEGLLLGYVGGQACVVLRRADAVDATHGRNHDDVAPREQARRGLMAELLDLLVDGGVLLDVGVGLRNVGLGLVVVVVGDEVDHRVVGEQLAHLARHLGSERLVGLHDERGLVHGLDGLGHGEGLARAGDAHEGLVAQSLLHALGELLDGLGLVAGGLEGRDHRERRAARLHAKARELGAKVTHDLWGIGLWGADLRRICHGSPITKEGGCERSPTYEASIASALSLAHRTLLGRTLRAGPRAAITRRGPSAHCSTRRRPWPRAPAHCRRC